MKLYIDSRAVGDYTHNTVTEIYVNGQLFKKGVLQMTEFSCVDLGDASIEELELKFFIVTRAEGNNYNRFAKCDLKKVPNILELDVFDDFREYDVESNLTIEDCFNPKDYTYAYSTKITNLEDKTNNLIFVFNEDGVEGVSICEFKGQGCDVTYERVISEDEITKAFKAWKPKWIKRGLIIFPVSIIIFALVVLLIAGVDWFSSSGKAQMALFMLSALLFLVAPNAANFMALKECLRIKEFLIKTDIIDSVTFDKFKAEAERKSKETSDEE